MKPKTQVKNDDIEEHLIKAIRNSPEFKKLAKAIDENDKNFIKNTSFAMKYHKPEVEDVYQTPEGSFTRKLQGNTIDKRHNRRGKLNLRKEDTINGTEYYQEV